MKQTTEIVLHSGKRRKEEKVRGQRGCGH